MEYKHINDCWEAIRNCTKASEVKDLFEDFPRWSGDWSLLVANGTVTVVNNYWDEQCESWEEDIEDIEVEYDLEDDEEFDDSVEMPWSYGAHFDGADCIWDFQPDFVDKMVWLAYAMGQAEWEEFTDKIRDETCLTSIHTDELGTDFQVSEDEFTDSVNHAMQMMEAKFEEIQKISKKPFTK